MKDEYVYMPRNITELNRVSSCYGVAGLPGCMGSIDVVHVKWANCPAGDFNRAKGKDRGSSPSLPANNFFSGGRPNFSMIQNPPKNRQTPNKERRFFDTTKKIESVFFAKMIIAPPHLRDFTIDLQQ